LSYLFVSLRIKAFFRRRTSTWIPEIFLVFGLILETGVCICDTITNHLGGMVGDNINDVPMTLPLNKVYTPYYISLTTTRRTKLKYLI
jgi:hypothetical protein